MSDLLADVPAALVAALEEACSQVKVRATDRLAAAHDASHYLLTPQVVVVPANIAEVIAILGAARRTGFPVTFRSGGTSLSGQAGSDGVLVDTRRRFRAIEVLGDGERVRTGPGATVRAVNLRLARHGRKLGPDPASEIACTIGGVIANNSSGMACGVQDNTYRTLESALLVLPSGTLIDTGSPDADETLRRSEPAIHAGLIRLRDRVRNDQDSVDTLRRLHAVKNTVGYGLNSFLDHDRPVDILAHLVVGSEGTLAFVGEATFRTVPLKSNVSTGLLFFPDLASAAEAIPALVSAGFAAIELMDSTSLRVAQRDPEATDELRALAVEEHTALLVEFQEATQRDLSVRMRAVPALLSRFPLSAPASFTSDSAHCARLWHIRKGLYATIAGSRPAGTTALLEDIAVPVEHLRATAAGLIQLFEKHGYRESVIFGHAKDGNLHFMINECFDIPESLLRYEEFTEDMVELVLSYDGTLKAEHGTGRMMAPFVRRQYGDELYGVMQELKQLIDPDGLLNPGVLLSEVPDAHLRNLKMPQRVEEEVDRCVECGYCEPSCPSRDLTLTPRERIVLRREMVRADAAGDKKLVRTLQQEYVYDGVQTCAVDGMCRTACPVQIDTGDLVRRLRGENTTRIEEGAWAIASRHWGVFSRMGGLALSLAKKLPSVVPEVATKAVRIFVSHDTIPEYSSLLPKGGMSRPVISETNPRAVYFPSCTATMFGPESGEGVSESFQRLCERAGITLVTPPEISSLCCGTPWKSKGLVNGHREMAARVMSSLRVATRGGQLPVVCDASSCTEGLRNVIESASDDSIRVVDAVAFVDEVVLPGLPGGRRIPTMALHPTCSSTRLGINPALMRVAAATAVEVVVPDDWSCCGFAGDRGMLHPELTASATHAEAAEVTARTFDAHASLNRTCELGMTRATGSPYLHVLQLLDAVISQRTPE